MAYFKTSDEFMIAILTPEYDDFVAAFMQEVPEFDRTDKEANDALFRIYEVLKESATAQMREKLKASK